MSLFYDSPLSIHAAFIARDDLTDTVLVAQHIWDALDTDDAPFLEKRSISITASSKKSSHKLPAISCWAFLDETTQDGHISIPHSWTQIHPHIFPASAIQRRSSAPTLSLSLIKPILLTEVFVTALSPDAYDAAIAHQARLESWFCHGQRILRQSSIHNYDLTDPFKGCPNQAERTFCYQLDMLEPVLQGYSEVGKTTFIVSPAAEGYTPSLLSCSSKVNDSIEIGEDFLASSMGQPFHFPNAIDEDSDSETAPTSEFNVQPLREIVQEDDRTVFVRTMDLGRIGVLNGDWAIIRAKTSRLVRVLADDDIVDEGGIIMASPTLLYNICGELWPPYSATVRIYPSPFGSGDLVIPTARAVTVARIASPISVDRTYQQAFLSALKAHFEGKKTLIKAKDVIAVAVNSDDRTLLGSDSLDAPKSEPGRKDEVVFFLVTNVDHDVVTTDSSLSPDAYLGSTLGELGCWFDPSSTQMNQTGLEHARVPDVAPYLGIDLAPRSISSLLPIPPHSALGKLFDVASVILGKHSVSYNLPLSALLSGSRGSGKYSTARNVARLLGIHVLEINCYDAVGDNDTHTEGVLRARFEKAIDCSPCLVILRQVDGLASKQGAESKTGSVMANVLRECLEQAHQSWKITGYPVIVCGISNDSSKLPSDFVGLFKHEIIFEAPDENERHAMLKSLLAGKAVSPDVSVSALATQTAALVAGDLSDLVYRAEIAAIERTGVIAKSASVNDIIHAGVSLSNLDFEGALGKARASYSEGIGAPKIPNVSWDDVGGLAHVKADILDTIQLPLDYPELFSDGFKKRSGILLYGPPGTGKTLVAKAVATSFALNFFSVKGPELLNMYIGESEANVRRIFQRARDAKPCVIFFDELDSIAPKRGNHGDSGGVMDRIVSQLLSELDGMAGSGGADVFVIGATNRPDLLDAALLRPGRFDRMLYLGVSKTHDEQLRILEALTRKFRLAPDMDLKKVAEQCSFNLTGADFYALCSDALLNAMTRKAEDLETVIARLNAEPDTHRYPHPLTPQYYLAEVASTEEISVLVTEADFDLALKNLIPSVSETEMQHYANIQQQFSAERSHPPV